MDQQNRKRIIVMAALGAVLVVVLIYQFGLFGGSAPPAASPAPNASPPPPGAGAPFPGNVPAAQDAAAQGADGQPLTLAHTDVDVRALLASLKQEPINYKEVRIQRDPMKPLVGKVTDRKGGKGITDNETASETPPPGDGFAPPPDAKQQKIVSVQGRRITAIVWDAHDPVAVVDDEIVHVGYTYPDGVQVHAIEPSRVVFKVDESLVTVEMKEK